MEDKIKLLISVLGENRVKKNHDITYELQTGLGGVVEAFYIATQTKELKKAIEICRELKIPFFIFGSGSKIAWGDNQSMKGLIIKNRSDNLKIFGIKGKVSREGLGVEEAFIEVESGVSLKRMVEYSNQQNLVGLEVFQSTIGTVGGSLLVLPALQEKIHQVEVLDHNNEVIEKEVDKLSKDDIILSIVLKLKSKRV